MSPNDVLYGLIQGATEFLPVSSSGHLALFQSLTRLEHEGISKAVLVHVATALAVVMRLAFSRSARENLLAQFRRDEGSLSAGAKVLHVVVGVAATCAATGLVVILHGKAAEEMFAEPTAVGLMLCLNAVILIVAATRGEGDRSLSELSLLDFAIVGLAQGVAIIPGVSRFGMTLTASLCRGLGWRNAVLLSLLISVPTIFGGGLADAIRGGFGQVTLADGVASAFAFASGLVAIWLLQQRLTRRSLFWFAAYCLLISAIVGVVAALQ